MTVSVRAVSARKHESFICSVRQQKTCLQQTQVTCAAELFRVDGQTENSETFAQKSVKSVKIGSQSDGFSSGDSLEGASEIDDWKGF